MRQNDFPKEVIDLFAKKIWQIYSLSVEDFHEFCEKNGFGKYEMDNPIESLKKFGFNRLEGIRDDAIDKKTRKWLGEKLNENLKYLEGLDYDKTGGFSTGTVENDVFIGEDGKISFYDFEFVNIYDGPPLAWIKIHGKFSEEQFDYFLDRYSYYSGRSKDSLIEGMKKREKIIRVNDVIWAAMKLDEIESCDYNKLMRERIGLVEELESRD